VKAAGPVVAAVGELAHMLLFVVAVMAGVAGVCLAAAGAWRRYRWHHKGAARTLATPPSRVRAARPLSPPRQVAGQPSAAIEHHHHHIHLHGLDAADVADIIGQQQEGR